MMRKATSKLDTKYFKLLNVNQVEEDDFKNKESYYICRYHIAPRSPSYSSHESPKYIGETITADQKIFKTQNANQRCNSATQQWSKTSFFDLDSQLVIQEQKRQRHEDNTAARIKLPTVKLSIIYTDNSLEFTRACEDLN